LRCNFGNCRSLKNKLPELYQILYDTHTVYDCLFFTETWLCSAIPNSLLDPKGEYVAFRKDRADKVAGGVCISKKMRCLELDLCT